MESGNRNLEIGMVVFGFRNFVLDTPMPYSFANNIDARILSDHASLANLMSASRNAFTN